MPGRRATLEEDPKWDAEVEQIRKIARRGVSLLCQIIDYCSGDATESEVATTADELLDEIFEYGDMTA